MIPRFLLDTNVVTEPLKRQPSAKLLSQLQHHQYELAIAAPVWHELWFGCQRLPPSRRRNEIETYLNQVVANTMPIFPYDTRAAEWHARERARLTASGLTPPFADGQIAAVAFVNDLTLITNNVADYQYFQGLQLINWF